MNLYFLILFLRSNFSQLLEFARFYDLQFIQVAIQFHQASTTRSEDMTSKVDNTSAMLQPKSDHPFVTALNTEIANLSNKINILVRVFNILPKEGEPKKILWSNAKNYEYKRKVLVEELAEYSFRFLRN